MPDVLAASDFPSQAGLESGLCAQRSGQEDGLTGAFPRLAPCPLPVQCDDPDMTIPARPDSGRN